MTRIALIGLLAAGCGGETPRTTAEAPARESKPRKDASNIDACALLTSQDVQAAAGWAPQETKPDLHGGTATCTYSHTQGIKVHTVVLVVGPSTRELASSAEMADWRKQQLARHPDIKVNIAPLEGLGVPAISSEMEGSGTPMVETYAKGLLLSVTSPSLELSRTLAGKAIARLP